MPHFRFATLFFVLSASAALALDPGVEAAIKTFDAVAADPAKLKIYCEMSEVFDAAGDDEAKIEEAEQKTASYRQQLGPDFEKAWDADEGLEDDSPDDKAYSEASEKLDEKCP
jgi:hypothetical protein